MAFFACGTRDELRARRPGGRPLIDGRPNKRIFHALMRSGWDGLSEWAGFRKVHPGIRLWNRMQFPVEGSGGKCDPEFAIGVGCSFPTEPQAETASHSGREFWDTVSGCKKGHKTWPSTYICSADTPMTSRAPTTWRLSGRRHIRFIASPARKGGH